MTHSTVDGSYLHQFQRNPNAIPVDKLNVRRLNRDESQCQDIIASVLFGGNHDAMTRFIHDKDKMVLEEDWDVDVDYSHSVCRVAVFATMP
jgi:hypothetical protein